MTLPLDAADRAACAVGADALATGTALAVIAWAAVAAALGGVATGGAGWLLAPLAPLALAQQAFAMRVALDARLFHRLSTGSLPSLADLDAGLQRALGVPESRGGRPLAARLAGARRLYRWQAACALALVPLAMLTWCPPAETFFR